MKLSSKWSGCCKLQPEIIHCVVADSICSSCSRPIDVTADVAEAVWAQAFIPKKLEEVANYERDHDRLQEGGGDTEGIYYQALAGMNAQMTGIRTVPLALEQKDGPAEVARGETGKASSSSSPSMVATPQPGTESTPAKESSDGSSSARDRPTATPGAESDAFSSMSASDDEDDNSDDGWVPGKPNLTREEVREARKQHQKEVKESNRERRKNKMPKKEKAKKMAKSKNKKK